MMSSFDTRYLKEYSRDYFYQLIYFQTLEKINKKKNNQFVFEDYLARYDRFFLKLKYHPPKIGDNKVVQSIVF